MWSFNGDCEAGLRSRAPPEGQESGLPHTTESPETRPRAVSSRDVGQANMEVRSARQHLELCQARSSPAPGPHLSLAQSISWSRQCLGWQRPLGKHRVA